jgi:hypothetical protein
MNWASLSKSLISTFVSTNLIMELGMHVKVLRREEDTVWDIFNRALALGPI